MGQRGYAAIGKEIVDRSLADARGRLKVSCEEKAGQPLVFAGFAGENHLAVMTSVVLESSLP